VDAIDLRRMAGGALGWPARNLKSVPLEFVIDRKETS
jgi:hypothetical protein